MKTIQDVITLLETQLCEDHDCAACKAIYEAIAVLKEISNES